ncbi:MAG: hypothetical protein ACK53Y_21525, partial [bacterium]
QRGRDLLHAVERPHAKSFCGVEHPRDRDRAIGEVEYFRHLFFKGLPDRERSFCCQQDGLQFVPWDSVLHQP